MADTLGISMVNGRAMAALLAQDPTFEDTFAADFDSSESRPEYDFHSDDIIGTLQQLLSTFETKKGELESDDAAAQTAFDGADEAKKAQITAAETSLENNQASQSAEVEKIAA